MDWYYAESGQTRGPITEEDWSVLVESGRVGPQTMVWHQGLKDWKAYAEVTPPPDPSEGSAQLVERVACRECGKVVPADQALHYGELWVCGSCKPVFLQRIREEGRQAATASVHYGGFWIRFAAKLLDGVVLFMIYMVLFVAVNIASVTLFRAMPSGGNVGFVLAFTAVVYLVEIGILVSYSAFFLGKFSATPGKMLCGLKVIRADGGKVTYMRGLARGFGELLSGFILDIGYIIAAFDGEKRALHDHLCSTRVIYK